MSLECSRKYSYSRLLRGGFNEILPEPLFLGHSIEIVAVASAARS
jgi:hypothetical protein